MPGSRHGGGGAPIPHRPYRSFRGPATLEHIRRWSFDLDGVVIVRASADQQAAAGTAAAAARAHRAAVGDAAEAEAIASGLLRRPEVAACIESICGSSADIHSQAEVTPPWGWDSQNETTPIEYVLDRPPEVIAEPQPPQQQQLQWSGGWLAEMDPQERERLGYDTVSRPPTPDRAASVWGLRLLCCLGDAPQQVHVAVGTHKSTLRPPSVERARAMGALTMLTLQPGDCVVAAATTLLALPEGAQQQQQLLLHLVLAEQQCARPWRQQLDQAAAAAAAKSLPPDLTDRQRELMTPPAFRQANSLTDANGKQQQQQQQQQQEEEEYEDGADAAEVWFWDTFGVSAGASFPSICIK
jgi:hypothetical protein